METFVSCALAARRGLLAIPVMVFFLEMGAAIALPQWQCETASYERFRSTNRGRRHAAWQR
jgi:hypothetical protein